MNNQPSTNIEGYAAARGLNVAVVQHCRIDPLMNSRLAQMVNRDCDAVIAVSRGVANTLRASGITPGRCYTVSNAIDIHQPLPDRYAVRQRLNLAPETFIFGTIGSLILRKSNHHVFQALRRFRQDHPEAHWKIIVVGNGPEAGALRQQAARLNILDRVIFTGFQNNAMDYLAAFDVFILASRSEGLPRVVLEVMLVNTVVIGSRVVGTEELISHNETGLLFDYGNISQLTQHLSTLWQDNTLRQRLMNAAAQRVRQQHTIESYVHDVEMVLKNIIRNKNA
ncbi:Glycosyltransferase involved in cell wall biosynthesis|nr:Glycosyltransferase involved in cell wall biosynthesis [Candidatus Pantoea persica]